MRTTNIMCAACAVLFTFVVFSEPVCLGSIATWALLMLTIPAVWLAARAWHYRKLKALTDRRYKARKVGNKGAGDVPAPCLLRKGTVMKEPKSKYLDLSKPPLSIAEKRGYYIYTVLVDRGHNMRNESAAWLGIGMSTLSDILNGNLEVSDRVKAMLLDKLRITELEYDTMSYVPTNCFACDRKIGKYGNVSLMDFVKQPYKDESSRRRMLWLVGEALKRGVTELDELADLMHVPSDRLFDLLAGDEEDDLWSGFACQVAFGCVFENEEEDDVSR